MAAQAARRPNLTQLKLQAKELREAHRAGNASACTRIQNQLSRLSRSTDAEVRAYALTLREAQFVIARENGFESWATLRHRVETGPSEESFGPPSTKPSMDAEQARRFWGRAFMSDQQRPLTSAEDAFVAAAVIHGDTRWRWDAICDVAQMEALVQQEPSVLESIGPALVNITLSTRGCASALRYLLDHNVPFSIEEYRQKGGKRYEYDVVHEAAWAGCTDNLRVLFESGVADATGTANPHTGWPDNVSLLFWPAYFGTVDGRDGVALTKLLLEFGADPEVRVKGNGERGNTVLQETLSPGQRLEWNSGKREVARALIELGAHYDVLSACALDDLDRVREWARGQPDIALLMGEMNTTPLHWAARAGSIQCMEWLLNHGADTDAMTTTQRTPLHLAAENGATDAIGLLSEHGAELNAQDTKGRTPLHRAAYEGQAEAAEMLIALGASTTLRNRKGKTPFEVARKGAKYLKARAL